MSSSAILIAVRQLDANHDPIYGNGQADLLINIDAVAQTIQTSLLLFEGEWWEDLTDGLPLFQSILGSNNGKKSDAISLLIQNNILNSSPFVTSLESINTVYNPSLRSFEFSCIANTQFGTIAITFQPGNSAVLPT